MTAAVPPDPKLSRPPPAAWPRLLTGLIAVNVLIEVLLVLADHGLIGTPRWRPLAYQQGAFWAGLLHGWQPNFAAQPATMFFSYAVLHAGPAHLIGNMLALAVLGPGAIDRRGARAFAAVYLGAVLGGGAAFGLLSGSAAPMVGASGAIFGLAAAQLVWRWQDQHHAEPGHSHAELVGGMAGLALVNLVMWWSEAGQLAWETHLGGALAGAVVAGIWPVQRPILA